MAAFLRNSICSSSIMTPKENDRIVCQQGYIFLLPLATGSHVNMFKRSHVRFSCLQRELNVRSKLQPGWNSMCIARRDRKQLRRLKVSSASHKDSAAAADAEVVSEAKLRKVTENSLEFIHRVALDVLAPPELVWKLWTDIRRAPLWMRWIDRVEFLDDDGVVDLCQDLPPGLSRLSRWICSTVGFEVVWVARVEAVESNLPVRILRWTTVEGLLSRGEVTFKENDTKGTTVELSISHSLPAALSRVMQAGALRGLVQATLQTDLECFQTYAADAVHQQLECVIERDGLIARRGSLTISTDYSKNLCNPP